MGSPGYGVTGIWGHVCCTVSTFSDHCNCTTAPFKEAQVHFEEADGSFSLVYNFIEISVSETRFTQGFTYLRLSPELLPFAFYWHTRMAKSVRLLALLFSTTLLLVSSSGDIINGLVDRTEYLKRLKVKYHLYDPQLFALYTECLPKLERPCYANHGYNSYFHTLDILFLEGIIALNESVDPSEADLFIVPVFYNQVTVPNHPCHHKGDEIEMILQMYEVLYAYGLLASFTGGVHAYLPHRRMLHEWLRDHPEVPEDIFIHVYIKGVAFSDKNPPVNGQEVCRNSLICLSIMGDTLTTDRIWLAFEILSLIGVLSAEKEELLRILPFPLRVPWEDIIVWIDMNQFVKNPYEAMRSAALTLGDTEIERRYNLMKKHRRDVLWAYEESVAVLNVLEEANLRVEVLSRA